MSKRFNSALTCSWSECSKSTMSFLCRCGCSYCAPIRRVARTNPTAVSPKAWSWNVSWLTFRRRSTQTSLGSKHGPTCGPDECVEPGIRGGSRAVSRLAQREGPPSRGRQQGVLPPSVRGDIARTVPYLFGFVRSRSVRISQQITRQVTRNPRTADQDSVGRHLVTAGPPRRPPSSSYAIRTAVALQSRGLSANRASGACEGISLRILGDGRNTTFTAASVWPTSSAINGTAPHVSHDDQGAAAPHPPTEGPLRAAHMISNRGAKTASDLACRRGACGGRHPHRRGHRPRGRAHRPWSKAVNPSKHI